MMVLLTPHPQPEKALYLGVNQYVRALLKWLPRHGVEFVDMEDQADIVHATIGNDKPGRIDVLTVHGLHPTAEIDEGNAVWEINRRVISSLRRAKKVIVVSEWVADILRRDMRFEPTVIPMGIDPGDWVDLKKGSYSTAVYVLWAKNRVGGVCDPKPLNELAERCPDITFVTTFGDKAPNVTVTGLLPWAQMKPVINDASIYLALSKETFGIQTLEAMICGVPVLGFNWGGTKEIVEHGVTGYLAEPGDYDGLAEGLHACLKNRRAWGKAAKDKVMANWQWKDLTLRLLAVCEDVLKSHKGPRVTVVIPCYNYGRFVARAIQTVLKQSYRDFELIIIDDGSTDDSWEEIQNAIKGDDRARALRQENQGVAHARNRGIAMGKGEFIACLDADDGMAEDFLAVLVPALERADRDVGIVYSSLAMMRDDGIGEKSRWPPQYDFGYFLKHRGNCVPSLCLFRREAWERAGGYKQRFKPIEDGDLWMQMGVAGYRGIKATEDALFLYNYHPNSATLDSEGRINTAPDNLKWQPWIKDRQAPLACLAKPPNGSWPVRNYDRPKVSVIIPVGPGHEGIVVDALDSLLAQTERHWEAIVVNDTGRRLDLVGYPFVKIINTQGGKGAGAARNLGIGRVAAPLILCLDADDYLEPECLEYMLGVHQVYGGIVYSDCNLIRDGETVHHEFPDWNPDMLFQGTILGVTSLMPKTVWEEVGGFDESLDSFEDWVFWLDACMKGHCATRIDVPLYNYRHLTGARREVGVAMKETMRPYFEKKYGPYLAGEETMGCTGCGGRRAAVRQIVQRGNPGPSRMATTQNLGGGSKMADPVLIRFVPDIEGARNYKAPSGRVYRFGGAARERYVMPEDVDFFVSRREFALVQAAPPPPKVAAKATPQAPETVPQASKSDAQSLTDVKGIGPASAKKLREAGIATTADIMKQTPEDLAKVLGFSLGRIRGIIKNAMELL